MKKYRMLIALALLAIPIPALAQTPDGPPGMRGRGMGGNLIGLLLERRAELELTAEQVTRLEGIRAQLEQQNAPLLEQLAQLGGPFRPDTNRQETRPTRPDSAQREAMRQRRAELEPVRRQLMENNRQALQDAMAVLTPEQQREAREILAPGRAADARPRGRGGPGGPASPGRPHGAPRPGAQRFQRPAA